MFGRKKNKEEKNETEVHALDQCHANFSQEFNLVKKLL